MEHRLDAVQMHADPRALSFGDVCIAGSEQSLDVPPWDGRVNRIGEDGFEGRLVPFGQRHIVSSFDIMSRVLAMSSYTTWGLGFVLNF